MIIEIFKVNTWKSYLNIPNSNLKVHVLAVGYVGIHDIEHKYLYFIEITTMESLFYV